MSGSSSLKESHMMMNGHNIKRTSTVSRVLQLVVCTNMVSSFLGLFFIFPTTCSCTSLPSSSQYYADKVQVPGGFQLRKRSHIHEVLVDTGPKLKPDINSRNQHVGAQNMMGEVPRKLLQLRRAGQDMTTPNTQMIEPLFHHTKATIKPAQLIHDERSHLRSRNESRKPSEFDGGNDKEATMKPAVLYHEGEDDESHNAEASAQLRGAAQSASHRVEDTIRPAVLQLHEEYYRRGRSALMHAQLMERQKAMVMQTEMRGHKELRHGDHARDQRAFHADYAEAHPHPPRNN